MRERRASRASIASDAKSDASDPKSDASDTYGASTTSSFADRAALWANMAATRNAFQASSLTLLLVTILLLWRFESTSSTPPCNAFGYYCYNATHFVACGNAGRERAAPEACPGGGWCLDASPARCAPADAACDGHAHTCLNATHFRLCVETGAGAVLRAGPALPCGAGLRCRAASPVICEEEGPPEALAGTAGAPPPDGRSAGGGAGAGAGRRTRGQGDAVCGPHGHACLNATHFEPCFQDGDGLVRAAGSVSACAQSTVCDDLSPLICVFPLRDGVSGSQTKGPHSPLHLEASSESTAAFEGDVLSLSSQHEKPPKRDVSLNEGTPTPPSGLTGNSTSPSVGAASSSTVLVSESARGSPFSRTTTFKAPQQEDWKVTEQMHSTMTVSPTSKPESSLGQLGGVASGDKEVATSEHSTFTVTPSERGLNDSGRGTIINEKDENSVGNTRRTEEDAPSSAFDVTTSEADLSTDGITVSVPREQVSKASDGDGSSTSDGYNLVGSSTALPENDQSIDGTTGVYSGIAEKTNSSLVTESTTNAELAHADSSTQNDVEGQGTTKFLGIMNAVDNAEAEAISEEMFELSTNKETDVDDYTSAATSSPMSDEEAKESNAKDANQEVVTDNTLNTQTEVLRQNAEEEDFTTGRVNEFFTTDAPEDYQSTQSSERHVINTASVTPSVSEKESVPSFTSKESTTVYTNEGSTAGEESLFSVTVATSPASTESDTGENMDNNIKVSDFFTERSMNTATFKVKNEKETTDFFTTTAAKVEGAIPLDLAIGEEYVEESNTPSPSSGRDVSHTLKSVNQQKKESVNRTDIILPCSGSGLFLNPNGNGTLYYSCVPLRKGRFARFVYTCPKGSIFRPSLNKCAVVSDATESSSDDVPKGVASDSTRVVSAPHCERAGMLPHPGGSCSQFYVCMPFRGSLLLRELVCPDGSEFNTRLKRCSVPEKANCSIKIFEEATVNVLAETTGTDLTDKTMETSLNSDERKVEKRANSVLKLKDGMVEITTMISETDSVKTEIKKEVDIGATEERKTEVTDMKELTEYLMPIMREENANSTVMYMQPNAKTRQDMATAHSYQTTGGTMATETHTEIAPETSTERQTMFECRAVGRFADPFGDCSVFYICEPDSEGIVRPMRFRCSIGLEFSEHLGRCEEPEVARCSAQTGTTEAADQTPGVKPDRRRWVPMAGAPSTTETPAVDELQGTTEPVMPPFETDQTTRITTEDTHFASVEWLVRTTVHETSVYSSTTDMTSALTSRSGGTEKSSTMESDTTTEQHLVTDADKVPDLTSFSDVTFTEDITTHKENTARENYEVNRDTTTELPEMNLQLMNAASKSVLESTTENSMEKKVPRDYTTPSFSIKKAPRNTEKYSPTLEIIHTTENVAIKRLGNTEIPEKFREIEVTETTSDMVSTKSFVNELDGQALMKESVESETETTTTVEDSLRGTTENAPRKYYNTDVTDASVIKRNSGLHFTANEAFTETVTKTFEGISSWNTEEFVSTSYKEEPFTTEETLVENISSQSNFRAESTVEWTTLSPETKSHDTTVNSAARKSTLKTTEKNNVSEAEVNRKKTKDSINTTPEMLTEKFPTTAMVEHASKILEGSNNMEGAGNLEAQITTLSTESYEINRVTDKFPMIQNRLESGESMKTTTDRADTNMPIQKKQTQETTTLSEYQATAPQTANARTKGIMDTTTEPSPLALGSRSAVKSKTDIPRAENSLVTMEKQIKSAYTTTEPEIGNLIISTLKFDLEKEVSADSETTQTLPAFEIPVTDLAIGTGTLSLSTALPERKHSLLQRTEEPGGSTGTSTQVLTKMTSQLSEGSSTTLAAATLRVSEPNTGESTVVLSAYTESPSSTLHSSSTPQSSSATTASSDSLSLSTSSPFIAFSSPPPSPVPSSSSSPTSRTLLFSPSPSTNTFSATSSSFHTTSSSSSSTTTEKGSPSFSSTGDLVTSSSSAAPIAAVPSENDFTCIGSGRFQNPLDNGTYYTCSPKFGGGFHRHLFVCPTGSEFYPLIGRCAMVQWAPSGSPSTATSGVRLVRRSVDFIVDVFDADGGDDGEADSSFSCPHEGRFAKPTSCSRFFLCVTVQSEKATPELKPLTLVCPRGSSFDPETSTCRQDFSCGHILRENWL